MNVHQYFTATLGVPPTDPTLVDLPVDSNCGADCKGAIDAMKAYMKFSEMAYGDARSPELLGNINEVIEIFWRG